MSRTLLLATDFSNTADHALDAAISWAAATGATLRVAHVFDTWKDDPALVHRELGERTGRVSERGLPCVGELLYHGSSPPEPTHLDVSRADWVFVGTHGRTGFRRLALGSWSEALIRGAPCPVVAVGTDARLSDRLTTIAVGLDLSPASQLVLEQLRRDGKTLGCQRLVLVHARPAPLDMIHRYRDQGMPLPAPDLAAVEEELEAQRRACEADGFETELIASSNGAASAILDAAAEKNADLIAVGTHSRRGFPHLLFGSVAEEVLRRASIPVYVARLASRNRSHD